MTSDHEVALAFIARRQASKAMSASRWSHMLSLEMGWMNPGQARSFVEQAVRTGLLAPDGDLLRLVVDPAKVEVPRGFRPRPDPPAGDPAAPHPPAAADAAAVADAAVAAVAPAGAAASAPTVDPFLGWVAKVAAHRGLTRDQVFAQVAATQDQMGGLLTAEAAALLLARRNGLDVADAARQAEAGLQAQPSR
ncbi:MAG TPA: DUF2240 family protein [Candidatus Thermoplasmatota archaeon]|nr:DUF2240 family protein [Candidatus Thermoplasmatota archaeon]